MLQSLVLLLVLVIASVSAFHAPGTVRPARMTMLFNFGKKSDSSDYKVGQGTANKGTYVPEGLTKEQYEKQLKLEAQKKAEKLKKFPKGKDVLSLTDWMLQEKAKGLEGKDLLMKGHRMVKAKYDEWYTNDSPV